MDPKKGIKGHRRKSICHCTFAEDVKVAKNIQTWWDIESYASNINVASQSKKELKGTKDASEYDEIHRRAVRNGNAVERTRAKPTEQLQLSIGSALLKGAKNPQGPKPEEFVS